MDDAAICTLLARLARPNASGGDVIERAAILAAGSDFTEIMTWVTAHGGKPEAMAPAVPTGGLHGSRIDDRRGTIRRHRFASCCRPARWQPAAPAHAETNPAQAGARTFEAQGAGG